MRVRPPVVAIVTYQIEYTDTFGGEANYSWVRRATVTMPLTKTYTRTGFDCEVMRRAKASVGLTGVRGAVTHFGDRTEFRPFGCCMVMLITA